MISLCQHAGQSLWFSGCNRFKIQAFNSCFRKEKIFKDYKKTLKTLNLLLNWQIEVKYFCLVISHTSLQDICPPCCTSVVVLNCFVRNYWKCVCTCFFCCFSGFFVFSDGKLNCREEIERCDILEILVAHPVGSVTDLDFCYGSRMINVIWGSSFRSQKLAKLFSKYSVSSAVHQPSFH